MINYFREVIGEAYEAIFSSFDITTKNNIINDMKDKLKVKPEESFGQSYQRLAGVSKETGVVYTPVQIAMYIIKNTITANDIIENPFIKICDPSCGCGGVALLGNFTNIIGMLGTFANGATASGVTKYIAEFNTEEEKQCVVSNAVKVNLICSFIIGVTVIIFHNILTQIAFGDTKYSTVFILFGLTVVFYGLNITISAVLNGYKHIKYLIITGMIGSAVSVVLAVVITVRFGLFGALINTMIAQICIFIINMIFITKLNIFGRKLLNTPFNRVILWKLFKFASMTLVSALVVPTSLFLIRNYVYNYFSPNEAGYIQGVWSISASYLMVITTTLSIYYLPTLSSINDKEGIRKEIFKGYKLLLPIAIIGGIAVYVSRDLIISILYTPAFLPMKGYFTFQIIGDTFKIASWILAFLMIAKAMTRWFIISEIIFAISYVGLSFLFMKFFGSIGVTYAYSLNYFIYLIFMVNLFKGYLFKKT